MEAYAEKLLVPVSVENPSGPDLEDSIEMGRITELIKGTPENQFKNTPAEPPDWRKLRGECESFLGRSKHLKVAVALTCSLVRLKGLAGFRDGMQTLCGLVTDYWDTVHPRLDPEDDNDPTRRLNIIGTVKQPRGVRDDWLRVMNHLYEVPIATVGDQTITLAVVDAARSQGGVPGEEEAPKTGRLDMTAIDTVLRAVPIEQVQETLKVLVETKGAVTAIDEFLTKLLAQRGGSEDFGELTSTLQRMEAILRPLAEPPPGSDLEGGESDSAATDGSGDPAKAGSGGGVKGGSGVGSRDEIVRQLEAICSYYSRCEPSSPVPLILRRVQKMVTMDFVQLMTELDLSDAGKLKAAMGSGLPPDPTAGT